MSKTENQKGVQKRKIRKWKKIIQLVALNSPGGSKRAKAAKASQNGPITLPKGYQKGAMATKGDRKGTKKEPEFTKNAQFGNSCAQMIILTYFCFGKNRVFRDRLENEKLRFDSANASGSRLWPSRKIKKNYKKTACEPTHL